MEGDCLQHQQYDPSAADLGVDDLIQPEDDIHWPGEYELDPIAGDTRFVDDELVGFDAPLSPQQMLYSVAIPPSPISSPLSSCPPTPAPAAPRETHHSQRHDRDMLLEGDALQGFWYAQRA